MIAFLLNLPWSLFGLFLGLISIPRKMYRKEGALIIDIYSWWWTPLLFWLKGVRAMAWGNVVILGPNKEVGDLEHELVHIEQYHRAPFVFFFLYCIEYAKKGYRMNKYEDEAYRRAGNAYHGAIDTANRYGRAS